MRIATSAFGLPSLSALLDDQDALVQYSYDDLTGVFTVQGLFDQLKVRLGGHQIDIQRQPNSNNKSRPATQPSPELCPWPPARERRP